MQNTTEGNNLTKSHNEGTRKETVTTRARR